MEFAIEKFEDVIKKSYIFFKFSVFYIYYKVHNIEAFGKKL